MSERSWPDPRQWVGEAPFPWPAAAWLQHGDSHVACYTVVAAGHALDAAGRSVIEIELADARGAVAGWLLADSGEDWLRPGAYVGVRGTITLAGGRTLVDIAEIAPVRVGLDDLTLFLPHTAADLDVLEAELNRLIGSVADAGLRAVLEHLLAGDTEIGRGFRLAPAATRNHHACLGGLFEHTVSVARLCDFAAAHYGDAIDRDLLIAGALLHDIGKVREIGARAGFPYTDEGRLLGHILLGLRMTGDAARETGLAPDTRLLLEHLIASHQGRFEWQSPREPSTIEAVVLHHIDDLDAKVDHVRAVLDTVEAGWTARDRSLGRELLRHSPDGRGETRPGQAVTATQSSPRPKKKTRKTRKRPKKKKTASKARKKAKRATSVRAAAPPKPADVSGREASRPAIIEPGMPGFIDVDTLDLFE